MVVIASANYDSANVPGVVRIQNAAGNSFDVRVDSADGTSTISGVTVYYMVVEEGVYTEADDGVTMEAVKYTSTVTDENGSWDGEARTYQNSYTNPVVLGQVMTYNDPDWSTFWSRGSSRSAPPSDTTFYAGKHVGEDADTSRADETIGYVVIEAGSGTISDVNYQAGLGSDTVRGVDDSPPYSYSIGGLETVSSAVVCQSAMDGVNGGWAILYGSNPVTTNTLQLAIDEDQMNDSERKHTSEQVAYIVFGETPPAGDDPYLETGSVSNVSTTDWTTVSLAHTYNSMVVVASTNYDKTQPPMVVRVRNAADNSFEVKLDRVDGSTDPITGIDVQYMVVEEGRYTKEQNGVTMEAVKFTSTITDENNSWAGEERFYQNTYTNPVVVGQVMTYANTRWSVFWSRGSSTTTPPDSSTLRVGKHVGEDSDTSRADEIIGYIVIEAGSGTISGKNYLASLGADTVEGMDNNPPFTYSLSGLSNPTTAIISQSAMDGNNGGWAVLYGDNPLTATSLNLAIDEDKLGDTERSHITEQVAYLVFE